MRLRDVRDIQRPYKNVEDFLLRNQGMAHQFLSHEDPEIRQIAMDIYSSCNEKLNQAKGYTMSFHFQILICILMLGLFMISAFRG